jgi:hypothetical protein
MKTKNEEEQAGPGAQNTDETNGSRGREVPIIVAVMAAAFVLIIAINMC